MKEAVQDMIKKQEATEAKFQELLSLILQEKKSVALKDCFKVRVIAMRRQISATKQLLVQM